MRLLIVRARAFGALAALVTLLLPCAVVAAPTVVDVTGTVTADDGTPIAGASVTLTAAGRSQYARSDVAGRFVISVPAGTYSVHAAAPGYAMISQQTVTLRESGATLTVVLSRATTNSLTVIGHVQASAGEVVSTSSAPSVTLNAQSAAASGDTAASSMVWEQLSTTPVLPLGGGSNATEVFAVRGPDPTETLVDLDGHQVNNGNTGAFDLSLLDPAALQDVQIVYGISPSSLVGPNTIGGAINVQTLQPTQSPHALLRLFGGSYGSYGETVQATGSDGRWGYAMSFHGATSSGSVNQTVLAPPAPNPPPANNQTLQAVGSDSNGGSLLTKLRYQIGGTDGYGYLQLNFRDQTITKDESALLTTYTPPGFTGSSGGGGGDAVGKAFPFDNAATGGYQSFAGTTLGAHQANYGLDAQLPLGGERLDGAPATMVQFSHLTTLDSQSVDGPGAQSQPYLYNQRDLLGDDWLEIDHRFHSGLLSLKYDLGTEQLTTDYVQGGGHADIVHAQAVTADLPIPNDAASALSEQSLSQVQRSVVLRYNGDPTTHIHYSLAGYYSNFNAFGTSFDPRAGFVWTPTGNTAVRASVGTTFQAPQLSALIALPPADRIPVGGIIFIGNPDLKADHATEYDLGFEQLYGGLGHQLKLSADVYQSNLRAPANQLVVAPVPGCQTKHNPTPCPLSYPVNAGDGIYRGIDVRAEQQMGNAFRLHAGWSVDSSYLTAIPPSIQDGTLVIGEQSLGQPLHKAYFGFDRDVNQGLVYGAQLNYEGAYNELNRTPYATLDAHLAYRRGGYEFGLYGTNLTNAYASPFTVVGGGLLYGAMPGQPMTITNAYTLQGAKVVFVLTKSI